MHVKFALVATLRDGRGGRNEGLIKGQSSHTKGDSDESTLDQGSCHTRITTVRSDEHGRL